MGFIVDDLLKSLSEEGHTSNEIKAAVLEILEPFFKNKDNLRKNKFDSQILSIFGYVILYGNDNVFKNSLEEVLQIYQTAFETDEMSLYEIIFFSSEEFGQKENMMWNVKSNTPNKVSDDIYEATFAYMKHIGDTLELAFKMEIQEICALLRIIQHKDIDYEKIKKVNFGSTINNIIEQGRLIQILKTSPISIKLSDWRNIAYHHTYSIEKNKIICFYGKEKNKFVVSIDELKEYTSQIIRACNSMDLARRIFLYDNIDKFSEVASRYIESESTDRTIMKISQLKTSLLTQGFLIRDYKVDEYVTQVIIQDLRNDGNLNDEELKMRHIHAIQFFYIIYMKLPNNILRILYSNANEEIQFQASVKGDVCKKVAEGVYGIPYLIFNVVIESK